MKAGTADAAAVGDVTASAANADLRAMVWPNRQTNPWQRQTLALPVLQTCPTPTRRLGHRAARKPLRGRAHPRPCQQALKQALACRAPLLRLKKHPPPA